MLPGRELTIDSTLKRLYRQRWLLIVPLFLGVLGGLLYSRSQPSLYRSDAVIQVVPQRVPESYVSATVTERRRGHAEHGDAVAEPGDRRVHQRAAELLLGRDLAGRRGDRRPGQAGCRRSRER